MHLWEIKEVNEVSFKITQGSPTIHWTFTPCYYLILNPMEEKCLPALKKRNWLFLLIWNFLVGFTNQMLFFIAQALAGSIIRFTLTWCFLFNNFLCIYPFVYPCTIMIVGAGKRMLYYRTSSFTLHNHHVRQISLVLFYYWGNWGLESLR